MAQLLGEAFVARLGVRAELAALAEELQAKFAVTLDVFGP